MYQSQTPIDIHCSKIVEWLVQRRHCKRDWGDNLAIIRRKMKAALGDMPENQEIKGILVGSKLDYFKSKRIVEILTDTEADTKNFFGYYSSQRMKDWQDIVRSYEKDCIFLAEIATDLIRETNYEVPSIKRIIAKLKQEKEDAEKEKLNLIRRAQQFLSDHQKLAQNYGIEGIDVENELEQKSKCLGSVMDEIAKLSFDLREALQYYREFSLSTTKQSDESKIIPMLNYIIEHGNTTVYEWKYGEPPKSIEVIEKPPKNNNDLDEEIDLGEADLDDEIDFGDEPASSESSSGFVHVDKVSDNGNGNNSEMEDTFIKVEPSDQQQTLNDKVARGDDAKMVIQLRQTRNTLLNNLYELEAFFQQLIVNLSQPEDKTATYLSESSTNTNRYDTNQINSILTKIRSIFDVFNQQNNQILFQMNDSPLFIDDIKDKLAKKLSLSSENKLKAEKIEQHIAELDQQISDSEIHLKKCVSLTREVQSKVQNSLRDLYGGRPINIMGCVG